MSLIKFKKFATFIVGFMKFHYRLNRITIFILAIVLVGCTDLTKKSVTNEIFKPDTTRNPLYSVIKDVDTITEISDSIFNVQETKYEIRIKRYVAGDYKIADTFENQIILHKEDFVDVSINGNGITLNKSMLASHYHNKNVLYHSGFGNTIIEKIDKINRKIIFSTFFGYYDSDFGEILNYSLGFDGKYELVKIERYVETGD